MKLNACKVTAIRILKEEKGYSNSWIGQAVGVSGTTVHNVTSTGYDREKYRARVKAAHLAVEARKKRTETPKKFVMGLFNFKKGVATPYGGKR